MTATFDSRIVRSASVRDEPLELAFEPGDAAAYETAYDRFGRPPIRDGAAAVARWRGGSRVRARSSSCTFGAASRVLGCARQPGGFPRDLRPQPCADAAAQPPRGRESIKRLDPPDEYTLEDDPIERERIGKALVGADRKIKPTSCDWRTIGASRLPRSQHTLLFRSEPSRRGSARRCERCGVR